MKKVRNLVSSILIASIFLATPFSTSIVKAEDNIKNIKTFETKEQYIQFFDQNNVPKEKQKVLLDKLDKNILWDAYNPDKVKEIPASFNTFDIDDPLDNIRYYRFEDGSFIKIETKASEKTKELRKNQENQKQKYSFSGEIRPLSVISDSFGAQYTDHMVTKTIGTNIVAGFRSTFYISRYDTSRFNGGPSWDQFASGLGCNGAPSIQNIRDVEEIAAPYNRAAMRKIYWQANANLNVAWPTKGITLGATIPVGTTMSLYLALVNHSYYVDSVLPSNIYN
ncbi:hypothetical protein [Clostridium sp. JN-9]|uniref:hypothetical protein n=1 Tax=Clostridium sp. JN-9 TaxID=2507159 RepID=UPI000FFE1243|nr:hypothetical protein [Clostridium sp. JN-9]QAT41113.1 hypothetical protein EQM05_13030 [Clostridium sp. JN-9]